MQTDGGARLPQVDGPRFRLAVGNQKRRQVLRRGLRIRSHTGHTPDVFLNHEPRERVSGSATMTCEGLRDRNTLGLRQSPIPSEESILISRIPDPFDDPCPIRKPDPGSHWHREAAAGRKASLSYADLSDPKAGPAR